MNKKFLSLALAGGTAVVGLGAFGVNEAVAKDVTVSVEGQESKVRTYDATVGDVLAERHISVGEHDQVTPGVQEKVSDGTQIAVRYARKLTLTVDGKPQVFWTTAKTVEEALAQLKLRSEDARLSSSRSATIGREGMALTVENPKHVTVRTAAGATPVAAFGTVADALKLAGIDASNAVVAPGAATPLVEGMTITAAQNVFKELTRQTPIPFDKVRKDDPTLAKGETKVGTEGKPGVSAVMVRQLLRDGKLVAERVLSTKVVTAPVAEVTLVGTKEEPTPSPEPTPSEEPSAEPTKQATSEPTKAPTPRPTRKATAEPTADPTTDPAPRSGGGYDLRRYDMWMKIAFRESRCNWQAQNKISSASGGLQFLTSTWLRSGGGVYAPAAKYATKEQQITIANKLYDRAGISPWLYVPNIGTCP